MATYASLLSLSKDVKKKKTTNVNPPSKPKTMGQNKGTKRSRSRSPMPFIKSKPTSIKVPKEEEIYIDWDIPDRQYGDLYCKPCDSHMNSEQMWEAHIQGKRHLKTVKKGETGEKKNIKKTLMDKSSDVRYKYVEEDPSMIRLLDEETRPIVGLQHLVEIQRLEQRPIYQCFLCSGNVPTPELLIEHIVGTKHRLAYLKEHDPERYDLIQKSNLKKGHIEPVVEECIEKHEKDQGRGKMLVKRELEGIGPEKERVYNQNYSQSRASKAKNYKSQPSKAKGYKNNDFDGPESTKSYRNKDWDCGRSTHSDRSYDGYPDDYGRKQPKDKEFDYYKRSPDRLESYNRSGYSARRSPDLILIPDSPDNDYRKGMGKNRPDNVRYGYPRHTSEREPYGYSGTSEENRYHSIPHGTDAPFHRPRSAIDDRYGDLREVLEKKKTSVDPYLRETLASNHKLSTDFSKSDAIGNNFSSSLGDSDSSSIARGSSTRNVIPDIPDGYLEIVDAMTTAEFLRLAYFKVNRLTISTESELNLLDKLSSRITSLSMEIKANQLPTNLQDQFKETMVKSGLAFSPQFTKDFEQIMEMVGQVKASSNVGGGNSTNKYSEAHISQPAYSTPTFVSSNMASSSSGVQYSNNRGYNPPTSNNRDYNPPTSNNRDYNPPTINRNLWKHVDSNAPSANSTYGSSSSSYIPGLTFTENPSNDTTTSYSSPFDVMSNLAKDILEGARSKTDTHRF